MTEGPILVTGATALADLGALVAALLGRREEFLGRRVEVAGDEPTPEQMARSIGEAAGRDVAYRRIDVAAVAGRNPDIAAMYAYLGDVGYQADIGALRAAFPEIAFTPFASWARSQL